MVSGRVMVRVGSQLRSGFSYPRRCDHWERRCRNWVPAAGSRYTTTVYKCITEVQSTKKCKYPPAFSANELVMPYRTIKHMSNVWYFYGSTGAMN